MGLADALERDRSNVNRSLSTLRDRDLVDRRRCLLENDGHVYQYDATPLPEVRSLMHETLDACVGTSTSESTSSASEAGPGRIGLDGDPRLFSTARRRDTQ